MKLFLNSIYQVALIIAMVGVTLHFFGPTFRIEVKISPAIYGDN